ncbi:MAG: Magnesium transporter MgtE [Tenericutes bacterium ADurb.Bin087]|nr:MAG: Magnesium transporter MgtE [Tenericutes bacterium ADurb.Bin087]
MRTFIRKKDKKALLKHVKKMHPYDIVEALNELTAAEQEQFYTLLPEDEIGRIIAFMEPKEAADVIDDFDLATQKTIIDTLDLDDAADLIVHLDHETELINGLENEQSITEVLKYTEEKVGAHMSDAYISLTLGTDIKIATKNVIQKAGEVDVINHIFIVDHENNYKGTVELRDLVRTKAPALIDDITEFTPFAFATDDIEEAVHKMKNYGLHEMAVVSGELHLIGILTIDDAIEIYHEESVDDFEKLSALPDTRTKGVIKSAAKRLPWLLLLLVLSMPIAIATSRFEEVITSVAVLALFQPLILDAGGDVASQTLAVTLRLLTKNPKKALKNGGIEILTGIINGIGLGIVAGIVSFIISKVIGITEPFNVALVVFISLAVTVATGPIFGLFIPLILDKMKIDPAVASSPLITTLIDITSVVIYFGVATLLLGVI